MLGISHGPQDTSPMSRLLGKQFNIMLLYYYNIIANKGRWWAFANHRNYPELRHAGRIRDDDDDDVGALSK